MYEKYHSPTVFTLTTVDQRLVTAPFKSSIALIGLYQNKRFLFAKNCDVKGLNIFVRGDDRTEKDYRVHPPSSITP